MTMPNEAVDHPSHYGGGGDPYEVIKVIEAWSLHSSVAFHLGNAVKYIARSNMKGRLIEDLRKAKWYIDRALKKLETEYEPRQATTKSNTVVPENTVDGPVELWGVYNNPDANDGDQQS